MTMSPRPIKTKYGWALATYPLVTFLACGPLICGLWLAFHPCPRLPCGFTRWILSRSSLPSSTFSTKLATITQAHIVSVLPTTTHHYNIHVCTPSTSWCPLVLDFFGPRCNSILSHPLASLSFLRFVFSSVLGDHMCVWVRLCPIFYPVLSYRFRFRFSIFWREAVEERNSV